SWFEYCSNLRHGFAEAFKPGGDAGRVLGEADAEVRIGLRVTGEAEGGAGRDADARLFYAVDGKAEAVTQTVDVEEAVEGAFGLDPADAVLCLDPVLHHALAGAAAREHFAAKDIAFRRQRGECAVLRKRGGTGVVGGGNHPHL